MVISEETGFAAEFADLPLTNIAGFLFEHGVAYGFRELEFIVRWPRIETVVLKAIGCYFDVIFAVRTAEFSATVAEIVVCLVANRQLSQTDLLEQIATSDLVFDVFDSVKDVIHREFVARLMTEREFDPHLARFVLRLCQVPRLEIMEDLISLLIKCVRFWCPEFFRIFALLIRPSSSGLVVAALKRVSSMI
jgi:hypothetical protein